MENWCIHFRLGIIGACVLLWAFLDSRSMLWLPWASLGSPGLPWSLLALEFLGLHGTRWDFLGSTGNPWNFLEAFPRTPWKSLNCLAFPNIPWTPQEFPGTPCNVLH